jgi:CBS domain-containing protein
MRCSDIMSTVIERTSLRDTVQNAAACMRDRNIGILPVSDPIGRILGVLTDRDIAVRVVAAGKPPTTLVEEAMTREIVSCPPDADIEEAEQLMARHRKSRILCIGTDQRPVGVISLSDIARHRPDGRASETLRSVSQREAQV